MSLVPDILPDDPAALKAIIAAQREEVARLTASARAYEALVQALKIRIARLKRQKFGVSSEKIEREIEQLQLALEDLEVAMAAAGTLAMPDDNAPDDSALVPDGDQLSDGRPAPRRRGKPRVVADTPRERIVLDPGEHCPDCGGALRLVGEDVSEILDYIAAKLKVVETARLKKSCRCCEKIVQPAAPTRPLRRGMMGANLLAHIIVSKFDDQLPLYRQAEIFARLGAEIPRSTLIDGCGAGVATLRPVINLIKTEVLGADRLHVDDTPIKVLDPSRRTADPMVRGVKEGRIWVYVRDDRPWGGGDPPGAAYFFSPDRKGEHPQRHLGSFNGILQADAYGGFKKLYAPGEDGASRIREAACWAHLRRDFHDVWKMTGSSIAKEALDRIGALYDIERDIAGRAAEVRHQVRRDHSRPRAEHFRTWCEAQLAQIPGKGGSIKGDLAMAMRYALKRWSAFTLFLEDGRVAIDNNAAERAIRPIAIGRKNFLFAGSDAGGETIADAMTIIETAKLAGLNPEAYLADVLARINDHIVTRLSELLPWNWTPLTAQRQAA
ncbi:IS66 family transposase [Oleomonas cavernae]|uniref:IS66 family transposase n=1 Tax=Oleomonas cavernae TaxID=2320859 RepID=A0A418W8W8_9PROT|nr:IS66 family transposase [Oleomonas cavernae]RJF86459.1 IS66 family transposase [Oleomonas cavernae]RJF86474.1 IS66 family transposase [Oleomonas cavernae]